MAWRKSSMPSSISPATIRESPPFGPCPRHELVDARGRPEIDELVEDVGDVGLRLDVVELARFDERGDAGPVFRSLVMYGRPPLRKGF